ncbi:DISP complex protein LRCH3-like isoform X2 [Acipenser ruthenus]|uniref:DISP complex protein LRCH3-like isoform X2 n=1 Tax=Acipenser ruthenus TaxID=7906 RepID=UPI00145A5029|nr:DISP complex protein LRCH3-like isoform X2 [Acipenser ruthenus]
MAAVVLMSVESSGPGFGIGGQNNSGTGASGNGHGVAGPASWNRSLDRALDEASVTGSLNLSGRKLKEFPKSAANHDLTDTTQADLSRNRLSELPMEVCHFVSLESLNLYQNCIRQVPDSVLNLQSLSYLNISRNQLSTLPGSLCSLPLKVLIACNNKLLCLPEEIGHLRQLTELDVSCNEIQTLPSQVGQLEALRDLNIRRNHLVRLPVELAELPLVRIDFSCNKIATIPVCYRNLRHLQTIVLENNPLQSPPAQICIKGKIHIFKYLNIEACKIAPDLPEYDRRPTAFGSCHEDLYPSRTYGALDSGFNSVDSGDKRWSGNEPTDEFSDLPLRVAEIKEQRLRRESQYLESRTGALVSNGAVEHDVEQIDFIDSCPEEDEEARTHRGADRDSLSSQFMAYIERRISHEGSPVKASPTRDSLRTDDSRRCHPPPSRNGGCASPSSPYNQCSHRGQAGVERARREAQLAALQYEEERQRTKQTQREAVLHFVKVDPPPPSSALPTALDFKHKTTMSPTRQSPTDSERLFPSRRSQHTDDSALLVNGYQPLMVFEIDSNTNTIKRRPGTHKQSLSGTSHDGCSSHVSPAAAVPSLCCPLQNDERSPLSQSASFLQSALQSPPYPGPASPPSYRSPSHRPESFLFRAALREEVKRAVTPTLSPTSPVSPTSSMSPGFDSEEPRSPQSDGELGEDSPLAEELRKNIESRLKVSLPSDLGAALTDGVVLCHLANHVRPRSVSSIHVPSPAVPKLTMAKCRRNVENFLEACRRLGVPQESLCPVGAVLQGDPRCLYRTLAALLSLRTTPASPASAPLLAGFAVFYLTVMSLLCALYYQLSVLF